MRHWLTSLFLLPLSSYFLSLLTSTLFNPFDLSPPSRVLTYSSSIFISKQAWNWWKVFCWFLQPFSPHCMERFLREYRRKKLLKQQITWVGSLEKGSVINHHQESSRFRSCFQTVENGSYHPVQSFMFVVKTPVAVITKISNVHHRIRKLSLFTSGSLN